MEKPWKTPMKTEEHPMENQWKLRKIHEKPLKTEENPMEKAMQTEMDDNYLVAN